MTYAHFRAVRIASEGAMPSMLHGPVINNTGMSRQVRRAHERQFDDAPLSLRIIGALSRMYPGQGLFFQHGRWLISGWPNERRTPTRDYSKRYAALFPVLPDAPNDQGRNG